MGKNEGQQATIVATRAALRLSVLASVRSEAEPLLAAIEGGPLDGIEVISRGSLGEALERVKASPLPPIDVQSAEVKTPADVYVDAICPECDLPTRILVQISAVLETTRETGSTMKLKAKAKGKTHTHHQLSLEAIDHDQQSLELGDIVGPDDDLTPDEQAAGDAGDVDLGEGAPSADDEASVAPVDDEDLRPTGEVNVDELKGDVERSIDTDDDDLLPA